MSVSRTFTPLPIDRSRQPFQFGEISERLFATASAHFRKRCKRSADGWTIRRIKNSALEFVIQIYTGDSCRFSLRHSRDRRGNRRCNTTRPAIRATGKNVFLFLHDFPFSARIHKTAFKFLFIVIIDHSAGKIKPRNRKAPRKNRNGTNKIASVTSGKYVVKLYIKKSNGMFPAPAGQLQRGLESEN